MPLVAWAECHVQWPRTRAVVAWLAVMRAGEASAWRRVGTAAISRIRF